MKKIGLRKTPFSREQIRSLELLAGKYGYEIVHFVAEFTDQNESVSDCEALMGLFEEGMLKAAKSLKWLHAPSAGVERYLDDGLYHNRDAVLTNSSGAFGIAISEYMICGLLMIQRRMHMYLDNQKRREWKQYPGISTLYGSDVTVVGVGDLGGNFAHRCHLMGAKVTGIRRGECKEKPEYLDRVFTADKLDEAIRDADVVALCLPATQETGRLFDGARIAKMKRGAIIINVGRGGALDAEALNASIRAGHLGGALLDVTDPEPLPPESPLWDCPNVIITPHVSGIDRDRLAASIVYDIYKDNLERYLKGKPLNNVVDRKRGY